MEIKGRFDHFNINVTNLEKSIQFYEKALGLHESHRKEAADGSFILVYLTDGCTGFSLELTWLRDIRKPTNWEKTKAIFVSAWQATTMKYASSIRKWAVSASRTNRWGCISSMTRMIIGLRFFR